MKKKIIFTALVLVIAAVLFSACGNGKYEESGTLIIDADKALTLAGSGEMGAPGCSEKNLPLRRNMLTEPLISKGKKLP